MGSEGGISEAGLRLRRIRTKPNGSSRSHDEMEAEEPVTPAGRLFSRPDLCCVIMCTLGFKNRINLPEFKETLKETLIKHKRFHSLMTKNKQGTDVWVRTEVDINAHVFEPPGLSPSDLAAPSFAEEYVAKLANALPLDTSRPLWECHVLNGTSGEASAHAILRVHHSLGDGTSLMSLLLACTRRVDSPDMLPSIPSKKRSVNVASKNSATCEVDGGRRPEISKKDRVVGQINSVLRNIWKLLIIAWNTILGVAYFFVTILWLRDSDSPMKGFSGVELLPKRLVFTIINIDDMRLVKDVINGTVNDVLMGMVASGLHRYLQGRYSEGAPIKQVDEDGEQGKKEIQDVVSRQSFSGNVVSKQPTEKIPKLERLRIRAAAMMNTRGSPGLQELQSMMEGDAQLRWGNHMGYLIIPIPLRQCDDPLDHVRMAKKIGDRKKTSLEGIFTYWSGSLLMTLTGPWLPTQLTRQATLQTTFSVSNVLGPIEPVMFGGNPIVYIFPTASGHPQSLCIYLQSYMGKASLVVMAAKDLIPDPETILNNCAEALQEMKKAALSVKAGRK